MWGLFRPPPSRQRRSAFAEWAVKDAQILVRRQRLAVLQRRVVPTRLPWSDRALVDALARMAPRKR
jgi:hypothetical protein